MERSDIAELMEKKYYKLNAKLSGYSFGNLYCDCCGSRLAYIKSKDYKYIYFVFMCNCGAEVVYLNDYDGAKTDDKYYADIKDGIVSCRRCSEELFYVDERRCRAFAFHVICGCGKEYNRILKRHKQNVEGEILNG